MARNCFPLKRRYARGPLSQSLANIALHGLKVDLLEKESSGLSIDPQRDARSASNWLGGAGLPRFLSIVSLLTEFSVDERVLNVW